MQEGLKQSESVGQARMLELNQGSKDGLEIHPNLWAGVGLVRGGAGTAMVGSHAEIADLIEQYQAVGIEEFVLSGYPHLEESYWFGEGVLPELARRGLWEHPAPQRSTTAVGAVRRGPEGRVMSTVAVVVGNPKPRSRTLDGRDVRRHRAVRPRARPRRRPGRPRGAAARLAGRAGRRAGRRGRRRRPGRVRLADLQGHLHRACSSSSSTGSRPTGSRGVAVPLMLGAGPGARAGAGADAAAGAHRDRRHRRRPRASTSSTRRTTTPRRTPTGSSSPARSSPPSSTAGRERPRDRRRTPLTTNQDLDPARLREAFGVFPSGVVAVAAEVDGRADRPGRELVHLGEPRAAAGLVLGRQHLEDLADAAPGRPPRRHDPGRPPRRRLPPAGRPGRAPLRRPRRHGDRRRRGHPRRRPRHVRLHDLPRGRGRRPHDRAAPAARRRARATPPSRWSSTAAGSGASPADQHGRVLAEWSHGQGRGGRCRHRRADRRA